MEGAGAQSEQSIGWGRGWKCVKGRRGEKLRQGSSPGEEGNAVAHDKHWGRLVTIAGTWEQRRQQRGWQNQMNLRQGNPHFLAPHCHFEKAEPREHL